MLLEIRHRLHFRYDDFVRESLMELRVEPPSGAEQTVQAFHLSVGPPPALETYRDWNGNAVHHLGIRGYHDRIEVEARSLVETSVERPGLEVLDGAEAPPGGELLDFLSDAGPPRAGPRLLELAKEIAAPTAAPRSQQVAEIGELLTRRLGYEKGVTNWKSSAEDALAGGSGVCQDFAHVMLGLLRLRGIPARYVSGYLHLAGDSSPAQSHAWVELHSAQGWVGFDPTHAQILDVRYVRVACGRHYDDVSPNRGVYRGAAHERLEAVVETREVAPRDVAALHRSAADLEVPVFSELPVEAQPRGGASADQPPAPQAEQQQQQQQ